MDINILFLLILSFVRENFVHPILYVIFLVGKMQRHTHNFITDKDFKFLSSNGINTIKIHVQWWIAYDLNPPAPFIGGSLQSLDDDFKWVE